MINKTKNTRVYITLPKKQAKYLRDTCRKARITPSQYISWIISKKAEEMIKILKYQTNYSDEELEEIIRIVKTPWVD